MYELFEGKKEVKTVKEKDDIINFQKIKKKLKFQKDIDLVIFCTSIGLYRIKIKESAEKENNFRLTQLAKITTFENAYLFDFIILTFLNIEKDRMHEFEVYFYTGFKILKEWFKKMIRI